MCKLASAGVRLRSCWWVPPAQVAGAGGGRMQWRRWKTGFAVLVALGALTLTGRLLDLGAKPPPAAPSSPRPTSSTVRVSAPSATRTANPVFHLRHCIRPPPAPATCAGGTHQHDRKRTPAEASLHIQLAPIPVS